MEKEVGIYAILSFVLGWVVAQVYKMVFYIVSTAVKKGGHVTGKGIAHSLVKSGGMPSGHTVSMVSLTTFVGKVVGYGSIAFAIALCLTCIIIYDAVNVRRAVGEQGKMLKVLAERNKLEPLKIVEGHTVPQVTVGIIVGILLGLTIYYWANSVGF